MLSELSTFLHKIGLQADVQGLQPLVQWAKPTAFRVSFTPGTSPETAIVKHSPGYEKTTFGERWSPRWKVAQDYVNLSFLQQVAPGTFAPAVYGYSQELNLLALQDLGATSLWDLQQIPAIAANETLWTDVARALARLSCACPRDPAPFETFATDTLPGFAVKRDGTQQSPSEYHTIVGMAHHIGFKHIDALSKAIEHVAKLVASDERWTGYCVGDLWHQHVLFHEGRPKFIDYHCGGYDISLTDLMRLVHGTPLYQERPLPPALASACLEAFLSEWQALAGRPLDRQAFDRVYAFTLIRFATFIVGRSIIQYKSASATAGVTEAVRAIRENVAGTKGLDGAFTHFLGELEGRAAKGP